MRCAVDHATGPPQRRVFAVVQAAQECSVVDGCSSGDGEVDAGGLLLSGGMVGGSEEVFSNTVRVLGEIVDSLLDGKAL